MFDRKVHHLDANGRLVRTNPFTEIVSTGYPNCIIQGGRFYCDNGTSYPEELLGQVLNPNLKKLYRPDLLTEAECKKFGFELPPHLVNGDKATEFSLDEPQKKRGRPARKDEEENSL